MKAYVDRIAEYFKARPYRWIDGRELESVGGHYAWRTRVSDCRRLRGMNIVNRTRRAVLASGGQFTISEYRYQPTIDADYQLVESLFER